MAEWLEVFTEVDEHLFVCHECNGHSLLPLHNTHLDEISCFFCDSPIDDQLVLLEEFIALSDSEREELNMDTENSLIPTGRKVCLQVGSQKELKRLMPSFSYDKVPSDHIQLDYSDNTLLIIPVEPLHISRGDGHIKEFHKKLRLKTETRGKNKEPYQLHLGTPSETHVLWQFGW